MLLIALFTCFVLNITFSISLMLNEYPFIMSHDAASGYLRRDHVVANWTVTQSAGLREQLDCGSRGFDYRPYYFNGTLFAHHGPVKIPVPMSESIAEIISWLHINKDEFVILYVNKCEGQEGCREAALQLLAKFGVRTITDCTDLSTLTAKAAKVSSRVPTGGSLLAVYEDCMLEQYDDSITCYGKLLPSEEKGRRNSSQQDQNPDPDPDHKGAYYSCYDEGSKSVPFNALGSYLDADTQSIPSSQGLLWMAQAHWQSSAESIVLGTLHRSSVLLDESRSGTNAWLTQRIRDGALTYLNALEVDNVCDGGLDLLAAVQERAAKLGSP